MTFTDPGSRPSAMLTELADLASRHKLVPFLGAGCSLGHLHVDWDGISKTMAARLGISYHGENPKIAQQFVDTHGRPALMALLAPELTVSDFKDENGTAPLAVLSLGLGVIYTTNQDNVFEMCAQKYGRSLRPIIQISDLAGSTPGDRLYVKYHGDLSVPDSVVFTESDFDSRIRDLEHFLNIRMRSDLLAKSFLFVGYSFRDRNVRQTFRELQLAFRGKLPPSYLLAFQHSTEMEVLGREFGFTVVVPRRECPGSATDAEAFDQLLADLTDLTLRKKHGDEIGNLFRPRVPVTRRMVTRFEIAALASKASDLSVPVSEAIDLFRALLDTSLVPLDFQPEVLVAYRTLVRRSTTAVLADELSGALFNLELKPELLFECWALCMTMARFRPSEFFDMYEPHVDGIPEELRPIAAAWAVHLVRDWGEAVNAAFRQHLSRWVEPADGVPEEVRPFVRAAVDWAWEGESEIPRPLGGGGRSLMGRPPKVAKLREELLSLLPKELKRPFEE